MTARVVLALGLAVAGAGAQPAPGALLFAESFEDTGWSSRGWYDGPHMEIAEAADAPEGRRVNVWHWLRAGDRSPAGGGARVHLPPVDDVTLSLAIRFSPNWSWSGVPYHPHMFHFVTTQDDEYVGPARTHLTTYTEIVNGVPRLAIQDGSNIDEARVEQDLVGVTEARAVAGCNGDADGHGDGDCYRAGEVHANGKVWAAAAVWFGPEPGPRYHGDWHRLRARFRLNAIVDGRAQRNGVVQLWIDDEPVVDVRDAVLRTGQHPQMRFNQFLMTPYFGPGVPHEQRAWVDDLQIHATATEAPTAVRPADSSWARVKREDGSRAP